ncbi:MAG: tRNA (adenosine(37)-N6)-dimethylallyltransferase MiaA [Polyangia bacterium]
MTAAMTAPLLVLAGPTASGKTAVALQLGERLPIEVVSLDSVQVYRGLDVGSAKPSLDERRRLPHHAVDLVDPDARYSTADWLHAAEVAIADIRARGRIPLVVGGTGLYWRALTTGLAELPSADDALRGSLVAEEAAQPGALHARLARIDAPSAARLAPRDTLRLVRALEVHHVSGRPLSEHLAQHAASRIDRGVQTIVLDRSDEDLRHAIEQRTQTMIETGLVEEARRLRQRWGAVRPLDAVGYREALQLVDGVFAERELLPRIVTATWQFARRQRTWFRKAGASLNETDALAAIYASALTVR